MEITRFIYQDNPNYEVEFEPTGSDNIMVNATMMAAIFDKKIQAFTRNDDTKNFISECLKSENSRFLGIETESDLIISKQRSGTWMHRILALKFAAWLDSSFEVWVYITIDKLLNESYREERNARIEKAMAKAKKESLKLQLLEKYPDMAEYFNLEESIKQADNKIIKLVKDQIKQLELDFMPELKTPSQS